MTADHDVAAQAVTQHDSTAAPCCPECGGEYLLGHPAGLVVAHNTVRGCSLQRAEDSRAVADRELAAVRGWPFNRPVTAAERTLLAAAGSELPDDAMTVVDWLTPAVRRRRWPTATQANPAPAAQAAPAVVQPDESAGAQ